MSSIPGNTTTTTTLTPGAVFDLSIDAANDADWFRANLSQGLSYSFTVVSRGGPSLGIPDPDIAILDAQGNLITQQLNFSTSTTTLSFNATSSALFHVSVFDSTGDAGGYRLTWNSADTIRNDLGTTATLAANATATSAIDVAGDADWFKVSLGNGLAYAIELRATGLNGLQSGDIFLYDSLGNQLLQSVIFSGTTNTLSFTSRATAEYFLGIDDTSDRTGAYSVRLIATDTIRDDIQTSASVGRDATVTSRVDVSGDSDWFRVSLTAGISYSFEILGVSLQALVGSDIRLRDADGNILLTANSFSGTRNALSFLNSTTGIYYIEVLDGSGTTGGYSLTNVGRDTVLANVETTRTLADGYSSTGLIDASFDSDWVKFEAEQGVTYSFTLTGNGTANGLSAVWLTLRDAFGNLIVSNDGTTVTLTFTATQDGPLFLDIRGDGAAATGGYVISVVSNAPTLDGTNGADRLTAGAGDTIINARAGNDRADGGLGDDRIFGSTGADTLLGGDGNDQLYGGSEADSLLGGAGADTLDGGFGDDVMRGGLGSDRFLFKAGWGDDQIVDFQDGTDRIQFSGGPASLAQLVLVQTGDDVTISFGTNSILIENIVLANLTAADFLFN